MGQVKRLVAESILLDEMVKGLLVSAQKVWSTDPRVGMPESGRGRSWEQGVHAELPPLEHMDTQNSAAANGKWANTADSRRLEGKEGLKEVTTWKPSSRAHVPSFAPVGLGLGPAFKLCQCCWE